jgi:excisionase family DNA binding protein
LEAATQSTNSDSQAMPPRTLTRKEASELLGLSQSTLDTLTKAGKIGVCRAGRRRLYLPRHIEEYLAAIERKPKAA